MLLTSSYFIVTVRSYDVLSPYKYGEEDFPKGVRPAGVPSFPVSAYSRSSDCDTESTLEAFVFVLLQSGFPYSADCPL